MVAEAKNATRLVACTPTAHSTGLSVGMTASEARALVPEVILEPLDPVGEREDRAALVHAFRALSDRVVSPWEDELVLEISRTVHLFDGEAAVISEARRLAESLGHCCRIAIADDPSVACALAKGSDEDVRVPSDGMAEALHDLPLSSLRPSLALCDALWAVGVTRIGQLARLEPASIAGRYGLEGVRLFRLARGEVPPSRIDWCDVDPESPSVRALMAGATSTLQIHFVLPGLLAELSRQLAQRDQVVVRIRVVLRLEQRAAFGDLPGADCVPFTVRVGRPTRAPAHLEPLIRRRLERLKLAAPVDEIVIEAAEVVR